MKKRKQILVAELFAGVGGFRLGLEGLKPCKDSNFRVIWSNQWEPASNKQHASEIYVKKFGRDGHCNEDIAKVATKNIPDHDLLVGGFPCQDYSVARILSQAAGINGKKGVLWWEIYRILKEKGTKAPSFLMLENVDRLLKSPASQRGRDFAIMLASLSDLGYAIEWRVINAADYGMPQRRRRIYILGYKKNTSLYKEMLSSNAGDWLSHLGIHAKSFPVIKPEKIDSFKIEGKLEEITKSFNHNRSHSPFQTAGLMYNRNIWSFKAFPRWTGKPILLKDVIEPDDSKIPNEFFINETDLKEWEYLKGGKKERRLTKGGFKYDYCEGPMVFPDPLSKPSRTIVTGEGGQTPSRFKHVIKTPSGRLRRLVPDELEKLNMFPPGHTRGETPVKRAFLMGNALVVGIPKKLGQELYRRFISKSLTNPKEAGNCFSSYHAPKNGKHANQVS